MHWLNLDNNGYVLCISALPMEGPCIESLDGVDAFIDVRAYRWDGERLVLDANKLARMNENAVEKAREIEQVQARDAAIQEAQALFITAQINTLEVDDATALRLKVLYPTWEVGVAYTAGEDRNPPVKVQWKGKLYRCLQAHTSQVDWAPDMATSLWTEVCETHAGTMNDPIHYDGNMALEAGKYYAQNGEVYLCTRDTINPVYNTLAELAGIYVEKVI